MLPLVIPPFRVARYMRGPRNHMRVLVSRPQRRQSCARCLSVFGPIEPTCISYSCGERQALSFMWGIWGLKKTGDHRATPSPPFGACRRAMTRPCGSQRLFILARNGLAAAARSWTTKRGTINMRDRRSGVLPGIRSGLRRRWRNDPNHLIVKWVGNEAIATA
jgi:hypothetical protein